MKRIFDYNDVEYLLEGLAILGTGGGGSPELGRHILLHDFEMGRSVSIIDPEDVPDDAMVASGGIMGSVKALDKMDLKKLVLQWDERFELADAFRVMEETIGRKIDYIVPCEMGGSNTPVILSLGARLGLPVIDGDGLGRASPETHLVSFTGYDISLTPMTLVDFRGDVVVVRHGVDRTFADSLGRWVITRGGSKGANAHHPMTGAQLKRAVVPNSITKALDLGKAVCHARENGEDVVAVIAANLGGIHVHSGRIEKIEESQIEGFYFTRVQLDGDAEIVIKNEAMALFLSNRLVTIFPDLICMLDPLTGRGLMSSELELGDHIALVVVSCHPRLRGALASETARRAFDPARFGLPNYTNQPLAELLHSS